MMRYKKIPPKSSKKKRGQRSIPLKRSVHINGERWGWEFAYDREYSCSLPTSACKNCSDSCRSINNPRIKIVSPNNKYFEISRKEFEIIRQYDNGQEYLDTEITPGGVKQYILDKLLS